MLGRTISHYRILDRLGEGGMGVVYRAEDTRLRRTVALKFLRPGLADEAGRERFLREAQAVAALEHPNICAIHEIGEEPDGGLFIVMPCYEGETLAARLERGPLDVAEALEVAAQVAAGLARAHEKGIIHRDLKPANVLLTRDGTVKILDFGLARLGERSRLTRSGDTLGTAAYMAPEQFRGAEADPRADIWALGAVLYEMVAGAPAFRGDYEQALMYAILSETPAPPSERRPEVPRGLDELAARALSKDAAARPQSAQEVARELRSLLAAVRGGPAAAATTAAAPGGEEGGRVASVAVLPFVNMSADPEDQYFGDGLAEELINALAQLEGLRVVARTSSFRFRGAEADIREIGRKLNVTSVLEGSVRRSGDRLRITAQLIDVEDGYHFWSERFDRRLDDIFAVQDEIARAIARKLEVQLAGGERPLVVRATDDLEAYQAVLEARHHLYKLTPEGWARSVELFQKAIRLDPSYAAPHAALASLHGSQAWWGGAPPGEAMARARAAAERALALDPRSAGAYTGLGVVLWTYDRDPAAGERAFRRALALEPAMPEGHINLALLLTMLRRAPEAVAEAQLALRLDPLSSVIAAWAGATLSAAGEPAAAEEAFRRGIELDPGHWQIHLHHGLALMAHGREGAALPEFERAVDLAGETSAALAGLAVCLHLLDRRQEADALVERLRALRGRQYVSPCFFAWIAMAAGDPAAALPHLEQALRDRDIWVAVNRFWGPRAMMRGPQMEAMLAAVGLAGA